MIKKFYSLREQFSKLFVEDIIEICKCDENIIPTLTKIRDSDDNFDIDFQNFFDKVEIKDIIFKVCCVYLNIEKLEYTIKKYNFLSYTTEEGYTLFMIICGSNTLDVIKYISEKYEYNPYFQSHYWDTAFTFACASNSIDVINYIIEKYNFSLYNTNDTNDIISGIATICCRNKIEVIDYFSIKFDNDLLLSACIGNTVDVIQHLITKYGLNIYHRNDDAHTSFELACCKNRNVEVIDYLYKNYFNYHNDLITGFEYACLNGNEIIIEHIKTKYFMDYMKYKKTIMKNIKNVIEISEIEKVCIKHFDIKPFCDVECSICMDNKISCCLVPCGHSFCISCISELLVEKNEDEDMGIDEWGFKKYSSKHCFKCKSFVDKIVFPLI